MDVGFNKRGVVRRNVGQLPRLLEKGAGLIDAHHGARAQGEQRQAFATVVAAQLHHVPAGHADLLQQCRDGRVQA